MNTILRFLLLLPIAAFGQPAAPLKSVATVADLTNRFPVPGEYVQVQGYRTNGDWGDGRTMRHNPTSTNAVDNGCVFSVATGEGRWEAPDCEGGHINVRYFDARGDGVTDDTAAFQSAFDAVPLPATNTFYEARGGAVFIPNGVYVVSAPLRMRPKSVEGSSRFGTVILNRGTTNDVFTAMTPAGTPPTGIWLYRVAHLSIHQAEDVSPTSGAGIRVQSDDGVTASMVDVEDVFMHGLYRGFHGSALQGSSLKDVTVYAAREDGILWDVYQTMVHASGCWTYYCGQDGTGHGWHLQGPAYCTVTASGADSNYGWGWYIEPGSDQNPVGGTYAVGGEQNAKGGMFIKGARGGVYTPMLVTKAGNSPPADGIVVDSSLSVTIAGGFTQQTGSGAIGYPLRVTNSITGYPSVTLSGSYLNSYFDGTNYHQVLGEVVSLAHEERGFLGLRTDGIPRRMLDIHDRTGAAGNSTGHELARLALHTADTNGNAYISLSPDGETTFHRIIANNLSTNTVFNYGTNGDTVFLGPSAPLSGDNGSFLFQLGTTPVMSIKGGDTLGGVGIGTTRPNPAALLDIRSSTRGLLLPSWTSTEYTGGLYGSGSFTPPGLLSYDSTDRRVRVQTRNATDGLTNNQYTTLFGYVDRDLRLGTAHRQIGKIWPQSVHPTDTNIGSVYIYFTAEDVGGLEIEQNSLRNGPFQFGTYGDSILRNNYEGSAGAYGNLQLMAGTHAGVIVSNGTHRGSVSIRSNLFVDNVTLGGRTHSAWTPDWVNVLDYGADDDPGTDDTLALQAAAAALLPGQTLYAPPGLVFRTTNTVQIDDSRARVEFSGSTIQSFDLLRRPVLRVGPAVIVVTNMDVALDPATNRVTGVPAATFSAGDMVMLYNDVQSPANYNPGQFAFVTAASGTEITLDRFPDAALQVTNAYRFATPPEAVEIRNVSVDLSGAADGIGISAYGRGHLVENCRVIGTGTTNDPNYIGIELRGQAIAARNNYVKGILDAGNASDRSGYGIFAAGDNVTVQDNELLDCKHCFSTSERVAVSQPLRVISNRMRQREDWAELVDVNGAPLFLGALDVHANVRHVLIQGNDVRAARYTLSLRNGSFDVLDNVLECPANTNLSFSQVAVGISEAFITRAVFRGNQFRCPSLFFYFDRADSGVSGTHSNVVMSENLFRDGVLAFDDTRGAYGDANFLCNPFVGVTITANTFERSTGTPLLWSGWASNAVVVGNTIGYGANGMTVAMPGDDSVVAPRQILVVNNAFTRLSGAGYDIDVISGPTNVLSLGHNRWSPSFYSYLPPFRGVNSDVIVGMHDLRHTFPRIVGTYDGRILFGGGSSYPATGVRELYAGALEVDGIVASRGDSATDVAFSTYYGAFSNYWNFLFRNDGLMAYQTPDFWSSPGTTSIVSTIVAGPRRYADLTNSVWRLSGALGITERATPIAPEGNTASLWLSSDAAKEIRIMWPDTNSTVLWHSGNDAPSNSYPYGRQGAAWVVVAATNHTHDASNTVSGQFESARIGSGTSDTDTFLRGGEPPTWDQLSVDDIPSIPASRTTSGTFAAERLGTGTATTNTFLQGNGTNAPFWGTVPSTPSPTNGIADAPADGIFYGRLNNAWTQPDISHLSGVSGFGLAWIDGTVVDTTDALDTLDLIGAGVATIDSPATYAVRVGSAGTVSTRHRLNLIASGGLSLSISDDAGNDESDVTVSVSDAGITYAKIEDVTASRLLGRGAGGGDGVMQELELGTGLSFSGTTINVDFPTTSNATVLGNTDAVTVPDTEAAETTLIGTIRSGESATFGAGAIATGSIIKVEAMGTISAAGNWADGVLRVKFGSSRTLAFTVLEEDSNVATDYAWRLTAYLSVTTAGATATTVLSGMLEYEYPNDADTPGVRRLRHLSGTASGTLDTTGSNVFDVTWDNATGLEVDWTCNHLLVTRY